MTLDKEQRVMHRFWSYGTTFARARLMAVKGAMICPQSYRQKHRYDAIHCVTLPRI